MSSGGEHVGGIELVTGRCFAASIVDRGRIQRFGIGSGESGEVVVDGGVVDDDVDQRLDLTDRSGSGGCGEDRQEGIEASLGGAAVEQSGVHLCRPIG